MLYFFRDIDAKIIARNVAPLVLVSLAWFALHQWVIYGNSPPTHAYNLARFTTGLIPDQISCVLKSFVEGRALDDYGTALVRFTNGALGTVTASQISHGRENDLWIEIDGTKGALEWHQEEPNKMTYRVNGQPHRIYTRGGAGLGKEAGLSTRTPPGHPEAFLEAFANIYTAVYDDIVIRAGGCALDMFQRIFADIRLVCLWRRC